ncbi:MAG: antibiotic biosynthesis monooxygenase [Frankiales bacterium]|nr:antibiotic biosynthesis monooxygenase [Frankiales bacterium]
MAEVIGVVDIVVAEGKESALTEAFEACARGTHAEQGCLTYALHVDNANPLHFVLLERWRSQADLDAHMTQPYVADLFAFAGAEGNLTTAPSLAFVSPLGLGDPAKASL